MARAPATHYVVTIDPEHRRKSERERQSRDADRRGTAAERGYDGRWQSARLGYLRKHPLCACCEANGRTVPAVLVDHVVPHRGDKALFWQRDNWQGLCERCHRVIKAIVERRWSLGEADARHLRLDYAMPDRYAHATTGWMDWHPDTIGASSIPLTIVCGPPCAGKSRWVDEHATARDLVIDLDRIGAEMFGTDLHEWPQDRINEVGHERNRRLQWLSGPRASKWSAAWFIVSEPRPEWRAWWDVTVRPKEIVVIATGADVCKARADQYRRDAARVSDAIDAWWRSYAPRSGDVVVQG